MSYCNTINKLQITSLLITQNSLPENYPYSLTVVKENGIHMEYTGSKGLQYIEGICNLYEFDCGSLSGWIYSVNGWSPNYGCGQYKIERGDIIKFEYTCNLGEDLGFSVNS